MEFLNPWAFLGLIVIVFLPFFKNKKLPFKKTVLDKITFKSPFGKKKRFLLFLIAYVFLIIALANPVIKKSTQKIKIDTLNVMIILSGGVSMKCQDIYPNRFQAAIVKIKKLFRYLKYQNVGLIIAKNRPYLISPLTTDYQSVYYLLKHVNQNQLFDTRADYEKALKAAKKLTPSPNAFLIVGTKYVKGKNVISYIVARKKCVYDAILPKKGIHFTYSDEDVKKIAKKLNALSKAKEITVKNQKELFYYPLLIALILIFIGSFSLRRKN
jgi:Ca-activated chloride channel family protein